MTFKDLLRVQFLQSQTSRRKVALADRRAFVALKAIARQRESYERATIDAAARSLRA